MPPHSAPEDLRAVEDFCNSVGFLQGTDQLADPLAGDAWLGHHGYPTGIDETGLADLRTAREELRAYFAGHSDGLDAVNRLLSKRLSSPIIDAAGGLRFDTADSTSTGLVLTKVLTLLVNAHTSGRGGRFKVCRAPDCRWLFYDESRPRTRVWCDMAVCGTRHKMAIYRSRRSAAPGSRERPMPVH